MLRSPVLFPSLFLALALVGCSGSSSDGGRGSGDGVPRTSGIEGRIVDADTDTSLGGVAVGVDGEAGVTSSSDGRFALDEPASDAPLIRFTLDGYREEFLARSGLLEADGFPGIEPAVDGGTRDIGTIRLVPDEFAGDGGLGGRITDPEDQPVGGVTLRLLRGLFVTKGEAEVTTRTDASGEWLATGLPYGNYTLVILPPDLDPIYRTVQVFGGTTRTGQDVSVPGAPAGLFSQEADESTWMLEGPARTVDFNAGDDTDGWGQALLRVGDVLLVGGDFQGIKPSRRVGPVTSRPFLAALDAVSGQPVSTFQIPPQVNSVVRSLVLSPDRERVYVGGDFGLLALDAATGALELTVSVSGGGEGGGRVFDIAVTDTFVYIGGDFSNVAGQPRSNIARLSLAGVPDPSWSPDNVALGLSDGRSAPVQSVAVSPSGDTVYVGGTFQSIDGVAVPRTSQNSRVSMLPLSADGGRVLPERFMPDVGEVVKGVTARDIAVTDSYVIVAWGGANYLTFHSTGGDRLRQYNSKGDVQFLQILGDKVFVGHHGEFFGSVANPIPPEAVASIDPEILVPYKFQSFRIDDPQFLPDQAWRITGPFGVWGVAAAEDSVWVAGEISRAGSNDRAVEGLARFPAID